MSACPVRNSCQQNSEFLGLRISLHPCGPGLVVAVGGTMETASEKSRDIDLPRPSRRRFTVLDVEPAKQFIAPIAEHNASALTRLPCKRYKVAGSASARIRVSSAFMIFRQHPEAWMRRWTKDDSATV